MADTERSRSWVLSAFMVLAGIVLLLPGLCVIVTAYINLRTLFVELPKQVIFGPPAEGGFWGIMALWAVFWAICLLISYGGIRLIRRALS